ncbi:NUDIX hydrolase [Clostridium ihumii]|uniref:NUDIX hydrolase n=1 Tax=Clostridium ihumii TaxID=1470356 RepID=UPI0005911243|nr:CoA pyrophosphatase [Clostridium ihumii]
MIDDIRKKIKNNKLGILGEYKEASVMILLEETNEDINVIFEVRAKSLRSQPGDICFPGGKKEREESPKETAIRETIEELNLKENEIEIIGELKKFVTPYGLILYPFVGRINASHINPHKNEVEKVLRVPLKYLLNYNPKLYNLKIGPIDKTGFPFELINGGENYKFREGVLKEYFYIFNGYTIWGYTAMILKEFLEVISD